MGLVDGGQRVNLPGVEMKRGAIHVFPRPGIIEDGDRIIRPITVVVVDDDLGVEPGLLERGAKMVLDELGLLPADRPAERTKRSGLDFANQVLLSFLFRKPATHLTITAFMARLPYSHEKPAALRSQSQGRKGARASEPPDDA